MRGVALRVFFHIAGGILLVPRCVVGEAARELACW